MVTKALIPVAGKATRLMPITSVVPKAMFPLVDGHHRIRSVIHIILEEVKSSSIEHVGIVAAPKQIEILQRYFDAVDKDGLSNLPTHIEYITQALPKGFGDAVFQAAEFIDNEPFMLLLGDHIYTENNGQPSCVVQVSKAFNSVDGVAMIGTQVVSTEALSRVGVVSGIQVRQDIYRCTAFIEKPDLQTARQRLTMIGLPKDTFLAHCGIYIFTPEIFNCISKIRTQALNAVREVELAEAQIKLLKKYPDKYFLYKIAGRAYDIGTAEGYVEAQAILRRK